LIAVGGSAAVAIGFALKDIVASIMAGLILLFDRPFQVGDRVNFDGIYGEISKIGLRAVRLITLDDNLVTIPNSKFVTDAVSSGNAGALDMMIVVNLNISLDSDLRAARDIMRETVATSRYVYLRKPISIIFSEKSQGELFWIEMVVKAYVLDVRYEKSFQTDIVLRGNEALKEHGILRPLKSLRMETQ
jgi:small-conductance mechanosensitive channel